jgi:hypothetical protein
MLEEKTRAYSTGDSLVNHLPSDSNQVILPLAIAIAVLPVAQRKQGRHKRA